MQIQYSCICHRGLIRASNQDNLVWENRFLPLINDGLSEPVYGERFLRSDMLFGVFDGMGGEPRGDAAAYIAAKAAAGCEGYGSKKGMLALCNEMNRKVCSFAQRENLLSCGTTAAMLFLNDKQVIGCNLGDSRIYLCRNGALIQQSEDHVLPSFSGSKPLLLQYLGIPETEMLLEPTIFENKLQQKDMYLVCSDGLTDMLTEDGILNILIKDLSIRDKATELLSASLASGGRDNITFILIRLR